MQGEQGRESGETAARFRRRLADLKRNGCNVLLVGTDALEAACERLLGESSAGPRYRLFVTTDARLATARDRLARVQSGPYTDPAAMVDWPADVRGAVAADGSDARGSSTVDGPDGQTGEAVFRDGEGVSAGDTGSIAPTVTVESDALGDLERSVDDAIASFESGPGELSPAELRLCFDSMTPLVADHDDQEVRRFLADLTEAVERVDGMGHYHLPGDYDSETVASVESAFDATVEVRRAAGRVEQRWHLTDSDMTTEWLPL